MSFVGGCTARLSNRVYSSSLDGGSSLCMSLFNDGVLGVSGCEGLLGSFAKRVSSVSGLGGMKRSELVVLTRCKQVLFGTSTFSSLLVGVSGGRSLGLRLIMCKVSTKLGSCDMVARLLASIKNSCVRIYGRSGETGLSSGTLGERLLKTLRGIKCVSSCRLSGGSGSGLGMCRGAGESWLCVRVWWLWALQVDGLVLAEGCS